MVGIITNISDHRGTKNLSYNNTLRAEIKFHWKPAFPLSIYLPKRETLNAKKIIDAQILHIFSILYKNKMKIQNFLLSLQSLHNMHRESEIRTACGHYIMESVIDALSIG